MPEADVDRSAFIGFVPLPFRYSEKRFYALSAQSEKRLFSMCVLLIRGFEIKSGGLVSRGALLSRAFYHADSLDGPSFISQPGEFVLGEAIDNCSHILEMANPAAVSLLF